MRIAALLLCAIALIAFGCYGAEFAGVQTVYLLPMSGGLDQFLANRLAAAGVFQVVTEPKKAQAVLTDRLGPEFEQRMAELFPQAADSEEADRNKKEKEESAARPLSSFGRSRGSVFLVDIATRTVLWSAYQPPKNSTAKEMDRAAARIVSRLVASLKKE